MLGSTGGNPMSHAITLSSSPRHQQLTSPKNESGSFRHHKVEDLTLKCEVGVKRLRNEAHWECAKAIAYGVLSAIVCVVILILAIKIAILVVGLFTFSQASLVAVAARALVGSATAFAGGKIFLAPLLIKTLEHQDRAQTRFNLARFFGS